MRGASATCSLLIKEGEMIEKLIRWMIEKFLKKHHLSHNPTRKTAVVDFPKEGTDTSGTFKEGVNA